MTTNEQANLSANSHQHVIVLVHGTFARGARWTRHDSPLTTAVAKALAGKALLTSFEWSGRNTHAARLAGGAALAERLRALRQAEPTASLHVVAHSHGGNVVAYALRAPDVREALTSVVCLGTPFILAAPRAFGPTLRLLGFVSMTTSVLVALLIGLVGGTIGTLVVYRPAFADFIFGATLLLAVGALAFLAIRIRARLTRYVATAVVPRLRAMQQDIVASLEGRFGGVPVLNVQARRDEAAGYLRWVDRIAGLPFHMWSPTAVLWITVAVTLLFGAGMVWVTLHSEDFRQAWNEALLGLVFAYFFYALVLAVTLTSVTLIALGLCAVWPKIFRAHALGFGEDGFMKNWLVAISPTRHTPHADRSHDELVTITGPGLHHSLLYQDERAIHLVATWLSAQVPKPDGPPTHRMPPPR
jgi:hypothetical protein